MYSNILVGLFPLLFLSFLGDNRLELILLNTLMFFLDIIWLYNPVKQLADCVIVGGIFVYLDGLLTSLDVLNIYDFWEWHLVKILLFGISDLVP